MASSLTRSELELLVQAAEHSGIPLERLRAENPFRCRGPVAEGIQRALRRLDPTAAARLEADAGVPISLATAAVMAGTNG
jgi:hypothetical protein